MEQIEIENQLRDVVSRIITQVDLATDQGRTDTSLVLEDALIPILKSVFNLPNLVNLNKMQRNYPGIDLGDDHDRVSFQVTATTSLEKIKKTLCPTWDQTLIFESVDIHGSIDDIHESLSAKLRSCASEPTGCTVT